MPINSKKEKHSNSIEKVSSDFDIEKIKEELKATMKFEDFKHIDSRDLYNEPFDTLLSPKQRLYLMDNGIIDCKPATKAEQKETYTSDNEIPYPWINRKLDGSSIYRYVCQSFCKIEQDMILNSDWFSQCHAVIIYNPITCSAMLLHVVNWDFDDNHIAPLHEFLKEGIGEAIFVYGSESRCLPENGHKYLEKLWCTSKNIFVSTWPYHRWLSYDPTKNKIFVHRKNIPDYDVLRFPWFSDAVYDREKRKTYDIYNRMKRMEIEAMDVLVYFWSLTFRWYYDNKSFEVILDKMESMLWRNFDKKAFIEYCLEHNEIMIDKDKIIIPKWFRYTEVEDQCIYEKYGYEYNQVDYTMSFYSTHIADIYYKYLLVWLTKHGYVFEEWNRTNSLFLSPDGQKLILTNSGEKVTFRFVWERIQEKKQDVVDHSYELLDTVSEIKKEYRQTFSGFEKEINKKRFTERQWTNE